MTHSVQEETQVIFDAVTKAVVIMQGSDAILLAGPFKNSAEATRAAHDYLDRIKQQSVPTSTERENEQDPPQPPL